MAIGDRSADARKAINLARTPSFRLGELEVSPATRQLKRGARNETLEPRVMQVLVALAQAQGAVITRDDLIALCWDGRIVGDNAIQRTISRLRELSLGLGAGCFRLETVNKVGYRLIVVEQEVDAVAPPAPTATQNRSIWLYACAGAALIALAAGIALFVWTRSQASDAVTIAVIGEHGPGAADFADGLTIDLAHLASARPNSIGFAKPGDEHRSDYQLKVAVQAPADGKLRADLSLSRKDAADLLWSTSVSAPARDQPLLRERASNVVLRVTECGFKTNNDPAHSDNGTMRLAFTACERLDDFESAAKVGIWRRIAARDPANARALASLALQEAIWAEAAPHLTYMSAQEQKLLRQSAQTHLLQARDAQPSLGLTYAAEASLVPDGNFAEEMALIDRGLAIDPDCADLHIVKAQVLQNIGRLDDARDEVIAATSLEPSSAEFHADLALALAYGGYAKSAVAALQTAERIWPDSETVHEARQSLDFRFGDAGALLKKLDEGAVLEPSSSRNAQRGWMHAYLLARAHPTALNIDNAVTVLSAYPVPLGTLPSMVHLGRVDAAYAYAKSPAMIAAFRSGGTYVLFRAYMRPFLFDRRFVNFADRIGLVGYWQSSGMWPDFCFDKDLPYRCQTEARRLHPPKAA